MGIKLRNGTIEESLQLSLSGVSESSLEDLMSFGLEVAIIIEVKICILCKKQQHVH